MDGRGDRGAGSDRSRDCATGAVGCCRTKDSIVSACTLPTPQPPQPLESSARKLGSGQRIPTAAALLPGTGSLSRLRPASTALEHPQEPGERIVEAIDDPLLERNDRVVRDRDLLGADLGAALRDVAVADAVLLLQVDHAVRGIQRMHLERRGIGEEARADELAVL